MSDLFGDVIYVYSRKNALEDGIQVDANTGDLAEVTRQHYKVPVYMTKSVWDLIEKAVENPNWANDLKGVWHDILWMSKFSMNRNASYNYFTVIITGTGRVRNHKMKIEIGALDFDDPRPAVTVSLAGED